jgi:hypothetical protein
LSQFYKDAYQQDPSLIFRADDFICIEKEFLLNILTENNHSLKQTEVWDKIIEWAIAQSNKLPSEVTKWTIDNMTTCKDLIQQFIPYINFREIPAPYFFQKIRPLKNIFDNEFYIKILDNYSFINFINTNIDSKILDYELAYILVKFIKYYENYNITELLMSNVNFYNFKLLVRGSENGFDCRNFHEHCDNRGPTITIAKVKHTNEILGGYNPCDWKSEVYYGNIKGSYIFSLNKVNPTFSMVNVNDNPLMPLGGYGGVINGPDFGADLRLLCYNTNRGQYRKNNYSTQIRQSEAEFEIEEYEVFQVCKNQN